MRFNKSLKIGITFFVIWIWVFGGRPFWPFPLELGKLKIQNPVEDAEALAVSSHDGLIVYGENGTTTQWRTYTSSSNAFSAATNISIGATTGIKYALKTSPIRQEAIAVFSTGTQLQALCYDGTTWSNEWSTSTITQGLPFDIAYEASSGDAIVLYTTGAATTNELAYRTKQGTTGCGSANWSAETLLDPVRTSGIAQWIRLATDRRTTSTLITAIWADKNSDLSSMVWSGTSWGNEPTTALETNLEKIGGVNHTAADFDVEYESGSADIMIVWSKIIAGDINSDARPEYVTCTGGTSTCTWSATSTMTGLGSNDATSLDISANPTSDEIVFAALGNAVTALSAGYWSGSAWTNTANVDASSTGPTANTERVATGWLVAGGTSRSIIVYDDASSVNVDWAVGNGSTFTVQSDFVPTTAFAGTGKGWIEFKMDPNNQERLMLVLADGNSDLWVKRLQMDSSANFSWTEPDSGTALETNLPATNPRTFQYAYWWYVPSAPTLSGVTLNGGSAITLTENATTTVNVTASATDANGYAELISATSSVYRSGVTSTSACVASNNDCYQLASSSCSFSSCSGTTCNLTCTAYVYYFADPTDSGTYSAQNWLANVTVVDKYNATGTAATASGVELNTLFALNVTASINYGTLQPGNDTGSTNQTTTITNTGNAAIDSEISGTKLNLNGNDASPHNIGVSNQGYATSTFTYSTCTVCSTLSTTATAYELNLPKPTSTTAVTDTVYWGLNVPSGRTIGTYSGTNTFSAIAD